MSFSMTSPNPHIIWLETHPISRKSVVKSRLPCCFLVLRVMAAVLIPTGHALGDPWFGSDTTAHTPCMTVCKVAVYQQKQSGGLQVPVQVMTHAGQGLQGSLCTRLRIHIDPSHRRQLGCILHCGAATARSPRVNTAKQPPQPRPHMYRRV